MTIADLLALPPTISAVEAATVLGVSRGSVYEGMARGEIPMVAVGRRRRVPTGHLLALLGIDGIAEAVEKLGKQSE